MTAFPFPPCHHGFSLPFSFFQSPQSCQLQDNLPHHDSNCGKLSWNHVRFHDVKGASGIRESSELLVTQGPCSHSEGSCLPPFVAASCPVLRHSLCCSELMRVVHFFLFWWDFVLEAVGVFLLSLSPLSLTCISEIPISLRGNNIQLKSSC